MDNCKINVMMFGGRRCGKTSVITAMRRNFEDVFGGKSDLAISTLDYNTMVAIEDKEREIKSFFADDKRPYHDFPTDGPTSEGGSDYEFDIQIRGRAHQNRITLSFYDFPGEWLAPDDKEKGREKNQILAGKMKTCGVIMIAIDTPYLMEPLSDVLNPKKNAIGKWNDQRNYSQRIATMVKNYFTPSWGPERKMILFVPLKCEKYYANGQMGVVRQKIREAYKDLLNYVNTGDARKNYEVAITPILTFGEDTIFFSRFREDADGNPLDEKGNPITDGKSKLPPASLFRFQNREADYSPKFCEQPLLYALSYLLCQVEEVKRNEKLIFFQKFIQAMGETFGNWASAEDFLGQREKIQRHLQKSGDGYEILSDPLGLDSFIAIPQYGNKFQTLLHKMGWNGGNQ